MYDPVQPDTRIGGRDSAVELDAKRQIVAAFEAMRAAHDEASVGDCGPRYATAKLFLKRRYSVESESMRLGHMRMPLRLTGHVQINGQ
jgi:hypothetical protein